MTGMGAGLTWGSAYTVWGNGTAMKIAFCFPGQGSQDVGMGRAIAERFPEARAVYDEASEAVGFDVAQVCFEGPIEELTRTDVQQPALVATSLACLRAVDTLGIKPDFVVGHSVGEYSALAAAASLPDRDAIALVRERGRAMAEAADRHPGAMAAVLGLEDTVVEELCAGIENVWPANYNCPGQVVVSGENAAVDRLIEEATARGSPQDGEAPGQRRLPQPARRGRGRDPAPGARARDASPARRRRSCPP